MSSEQESSTDPIYESSLRELKWILLIWLVTFLWVIGYCSLFGYQADGELLTTILGMPSWVFWGIFVPWIVVAAVSSWFALTQIEDHPLEDSASEEAAAEEQPNG